VHLYLSPTSPFARWVLVVIREYGLPQPDIVITDPWQSPSALTELNPFAIVPVLARDDGSVLYESLIIVDALLADVGAVKQPDSLPRLSFGKALLETTFRHVSLVSHAPKEAEPHPFIARTRDALDRALARLPTMLPSSPDARDIGHLLLAVALDYLCFRLPELAERHAHVIHPFLAFFNKRASFMETTPDALR
jgi:glutathione S-transferase